MQASLLSMALAKRIVKVRVDNSCRVDTRTTTLYTDGTHDTTRTLKHPHRPVIYCPACYGLKITNNPT